MSDYTRFLLASAGIEATEQEIAAIDASGQSVSVAILLTQEHARKGWNAAREFSASMDRLHALAGHTQEQIGDVSQGLLDLAKGDEG